MKYIYLEPTGGLGNRMRSISSCIWLSQVSDARLIIVWKKGRDFNSTFEDIFLNSDYFTIENYRNKYNYLKNNIQKSFLKRYITRIINRVLGFDFVATDPYFKNQESNILGIIEIYKKVYFKTHEDFGNNLPYYSAFIPTPSIQSKINEFINENFDKYVIGVHIRRSDNFESIINSPLRSFYEKLDYEIQQRDNLKFFLATDDIDIEEEIIKKYGSSVLVRRKNLKRNNTEGIIDAVIDLWCLSSTKIIYGSYWSSFSSAASRIGNTKLIVVRKKDH